jgi:hypothetical protein
MRRLPAVRAPTSGGRARATTRRSVSESVAVGVATGGKLGPMTRTFELLVVIA